MNYTPQLFNEMAAKAEGIDVYSKDSKGIWVANAEDTWINLYKPHDDLNQLMPLAWKYGAYLISSSCDGADVDYDIYIQAIRDCLWQIWSEGNTNE